MSNTLISQVSPSQASSELRRFADNLARNLEEVRFTFFQHSVPVIGLGTSAVVQARRSGTTFIISTLPLTSSQEREIRKILESGLPSGIPGG